MSASQSCPSSREERDTGAESSAAVRLRCERCGRESEYDRSIDPDIPSWVVTLSQSHCDAEGCDAGDRLVETWLDANGVARDPEETVGSGAAPSGWRTIASAPRTPRGEAAVPVIMGFAADEEGYSPTSREGFWNPHLSCWTSTLDPKWRGPQPTHWMPLPEPPQ